ncbi:2-(1,2-epoxy-1,2-dihydrophenyl)acetyl-CoA isomerase [Marinobacter daqiaonensis]|uniref:2-(1,2-epoxy-1,2-dihydrophenyl)acetyl-CoA isomerase n=1 Tax=Marinobacter daqiaonensis TaxID=650891 RepID=A0A1I6INV5_9GAMM|nr:enoyl-CoA hydratase/isomerase family protein [Marinobacter daqiaonensis]SFR68437.1 2-(1,2-epoxy-1,2-dihydrophenyl)acetyl-CoA isomerase [Marinobacter daqiaonensis]
MTQVLYRLEAGIARLTLNRPERHNALVPELLRDLRRALAQCGQDRPGALVIDSAGKSFSTGGDVAGFHDIAREFRARYGAEVVGELNRAILDLLTLPVPTVVAVHGMVTGGSLGLILASDIVVAGPQASFAPWYTVVGYSPDGGWTALLPERIGRARALEIQLTNRTMNQDEALGCGLAQYPADAGEELDRALTIANQIRARKPGSVRRTLRLTRPDPGHVAGALEREYREFLEQITTDEADLGMADFLGRTP